MCFSVNLIIVGQKMIFTESKKSYQDVLICKKKLPENSLKYTHFKLMIYAKWNLSNMYICKW